MKKTNAMRILDTLKIKYEAKEYDDDGEHPLAKGAANRTAEKLELIQKQYIKQSLCEQTQKN